ncbi:hypothetical protein AB4059_08850 [Lysobacter sp. 2RAF19]
MTMNANSTPSQSRDKATRHDEMIALAREIRGEFAKLHAQMGKILARAEQKKAA